MAKIVLCSASPRRQELLRHIGMGKKAEKLETAMSRCKLRVTGSPENARCSAYADELLSNL